MSKELSAELGRLKERNANLLTKCESLWAALAEAVTLRNSALKELSEMEKERDIALAKLERCRDTIGSVVRLTDPNGRKD